MSQLLSERRKHASQNLDTSQKPRFKYGLTTSLSFPSIDLGQLSEVTSSQEVKNIHDNCECLDLFNNLDHPQIQPHFLSTTLHESDQLELYSELYADIGMAIIVPENSQATVDLTRTLTSTSFKEHILIIAGTNSSLTLIDNFSSQKTQLHTGTVEIIAKPGSSVKFASIQNNSPESVHARSYRASIHKDASVEFFIVNFGSAFSRSIVESTLIGEGAHTKIYGVFLGSKKQQIDFSSSAYHKANHTTSDMFARGVLTGKARGVYRGLIDIDKDAYNCDGYQQEHTLLLSKTAIADAIPNLEIRNNQVKCSHGATIGRIDDEQLFYLTSKGIPEQLATHLIVEGFFEPVSAKLHWPQLFSIIKPIVQEKIA